MNWSVVIIDHIILLYYGVMWHYYNIVNVLKCILLNLYYLLLVDLKKWEHHLIEEPVPTTTTQGDC